MNFLWMQVPPQTFWGWVFELALAGPALFVAFWTIVFTFEALGQSYQTHRNNTIQRIESRAADSAAQQIDRLYRQSTEEVRKLAEGP
jgi:hypothetical protein